jgi:hypothetical protein
MRWITTVEDTSSWRSIEIVAELQIVFSDLMLIKMMLD